MSKLSEKTVSTVFSKSQLAEVRVLSDSLKKLSPEINFVALLLDEPEDYFEPEKENFKCLTLEHCALKHLKKTTALAFNRDDLCELVKPYFIATLLENTEQVLYLQPKTILLADISEMFDLSPEKSVCLYYHVDYRDKALRDMTLATPVFRKDMVIFSRDENSMQVLRWWQQMTLRHFNCDLQFMSGAPYLFDCIEAQASPIFDSGDFRSFFVDQKEPFRTWQSCTTQSDTSCRGYALDLSWDPLASWNSGEMSPLSGIYENYRQSLLSAGYRETHYFPYSFNFLEDGEFIPPILRACFRAYLEQYKHYGTTRSFEQFVFTPNEKLHGHCIPPLLKYIYEQRRDLQDTFKNLINPNSFIGWMNIHGACEYQMISLWNKYQANITQLSVTQILKWIVEREDLRAAFPTAFVTAEGNNQLAEWVELHAIKEYGITAEVKSALLDMLRNPLSGTVPHLMQGAVELQARFPLGLTRVQASTFIEHLSQQGAYARKCDPRWVQWFNCAVGRDWIHDLVETWHRNRILRSQFPLALTAFGYQDYLDYIYSLASQIDPSQDWSFIKNFNLAHATSIPSQVKALHRANEEFRATFPKLFSNENQDLLNLQKSLPELKDWFHKHRWQFNLSKEWLHEFDVQFLAFLNRQEIGVNYVGLIAGATGLGCAARAHISAFESVKIPVQRFEIAVGQRLTHNASSNSFSEAEVLHPINIFHCNDDLLKEGISQFGGNNTRGRLNIAYSVWELEEFSPKVPFENYVDEIWTPSAFSAAAISASVSVPVQIVPHPIEVPKNVVAMRKKLDIDEDVFMYLFITDAKSRLRRKNVDAIIEAFRLSLQSDDKKCCLVLKISDPWVEEQEVAKLIEAAKDLPVKFIWDCLPERELYGLIAGCDAYVSMHRSEGFGLTLAEAMAYGKAVIATGYSGNMEFMNINNSFPLRYEISDSPVYDEFYGLTHLANPSISHAAEIMTLVRQNRSLTEQIGKIAKRDIEQHFSKSRIGEIMKARLKLLQAKRQNSINFEARSQKLVQADVLTEIAIPQTLQTNSTEETHSKSGDLLDSPTGIIPEKA